MNRRAGAFLAASVLALALPMEGAATARRVALSGSLGLVSDYRYRGVSLSNGRPAVQAEMEAERNGWFADGWASLSASGNAGSELDLAFGRRSRLAGLDYSVSAQAHLFNNAGDPRSIELAGELGRQLGPARLDAELSYAPRQSGSGSDNVYVGGQLSWPIPATPLSAHVRGGLENGFYRRKLDWEAGLSAPVGPLILSAAIVGQSSQGDRCGCGGSGLVLGLMRGW